MNIYKKASLITLVMASFVYLASCGSSGGSRPASTSSSTSSGGTSTSSGGSSNTSGGSSTSGGTTSSCVAPHTGATWTKTVCGPIDVVSLDQSATGDDGTVLGSRSVNKGRASFKITGVSDSLSFGEKWNLMFLAQTAGGGGGESNWQMMVLSSNENRFIQQRFDDFTACSPRGLNGGRWGCEEQDIHSDLSFDPNKTYNFECSWNQDSGYRADCVVTTTDGSFTTTFSVGTGGGYSALLEFTVGTFSYQGYPAVDTIVKDFRFSVM